MDIPNERSSHVNITPRGAGVVTGIMFFLSMIYFQQELFLELSYPMTALLIVFLCGIIDDIKPLGSKKKFIFIIIGALIISYDGYVIDHIGNYLGKDLYLGYLAIPFTVFAIVGFTNALNLTDGLDGLAGGISLVIFLTLFVIGIMNNDKILTTIPLFMISILVAFLFLNWNPAKIFMGDSGSLFFGFLISFLAIHALDYISPTAVLFLAAIPVLDTLIVFRRRIQRGKSPFEADKNHMHHILQKTKRDVKFTVSTLIMIQAAFCLIFLQILDSKDSLNIILFYILYLIFFNLFDPRVRPRRKKKKKKRKNDKYMKLLMRKEDAVIQNEITTKTDEVS